MGKILKIIIVGCCAVLVIMSSLLCACSTDQPDREPEAQQNEPANENKVPEFTILETVEQGNSVVISTTYGAFEYPAAFSDLIKVKSEPTESAAKLQFFADVNGTEVLVYTILFGSTEGISVGTLQKTEWTEPVSVTVVFSEEPIGLDENELITYYAAQETFNDVIQSFAANGGFTFAE